VPETITLEPGASTTSAPVRALTAGDARLGEYESRAWMLSVEASP